jgi:hypothetical protein
MLLRGTVWGAAVISARVASRTTKVAGRASLALACLAVGCTSKAEPSGPPALAASEQALSSTVVSAQEIQRRRDNIRAFFKAQADALPGKKATTTTPAGTIIDWVDASAQGPVAKPPAEPPSGESKCQDTRCATTEVDADPSLEGPPGTVPVVRFDVEKYLSAVPIPPAQPEQVLRKMPPPSPEANGRYYVGWKHSDSYWGSSGYINLWDGGGPENNYDTDIAQVAVYGGSTVQSVEAGKIESVLLNGDSVPHFFTYFTTVGYASEGNWVGGYNTNVQGWHQVSSTRAPGMVLSPLSTTNGWQYELYLDVRRSETGDWWVFMNSEWIGYYPYCKQELSDCSNGTLFAADGMRDIASNIQWYGEVADGNAPSATTTDMGSGAFGWYGVAAYFRNMTEFFAPVNYYYFGSDVPFHIVTDPNCYAGSGPYASDQSGWMNYFFYGGPGADSGGCI